MTEVSEEKDFLIEMIYEKVDKNIFNRDNVTTLLDYINFICHNTDKIMASEFNKSLLWRHYVYNTKLYNNEEEFCKKWYSYILNIVDFIMSDLCNHYIQKSVDYFIQQDSKLKEKLQ